MGKIKKTLRLDPENRKFLGVCAGLANFLEVEATAVRLVYLALCIFGGWFLIPLYFIAWFLLDESSEPMRNSLADNMMVNHFKTVDYKKKIYRNTRDGKIWGVCAGIADYLEVNVFAVRLFFLGMVFLTGFPVLLYVGARLVLDEKPLSEYDAEPPVMTPRARPQAETVHSAPSQTGSATRKDTDGQHSQQGETKSGKFSKRREFQYCVHKFSTLHSRLAKMEAYVTSSRFRLHREFKNIS